MRTRPAQVPAGDCAYEQRQEKSCGCKGETCCWPVCAAQRVALTPSSVGGYARAAAAAFQSPEDSLVLGQLARHTLLAGYVDPAARATTAKQAAEMRLAAAPIKCCDWTMGGPWGGNADLVADYLSGMHGRCYGDGSVHFEHFSAGLIATGGAD